MLLKQGDKGPDVKKLVSDLIKLGFAPKSGKGDDFTSDVKKAVRAFQSQGIGPNLIPLVVDGQVGPLTRWALDVALGKIATPAVPAVPIDAATARPKSASKTGWNALQIAVAEMNAGAGEVGGDNAGPHVMKYHAVTGASSGDSWCASFVSYCFKTGNPGAMPFQPTAGARDLLGKFKKNGWDFKASIDNPPMPGDIIVWWRDSLDGWKGHIGIVSSYANGVVKTIEGNRGSFPSKVSSFQYTLGQIDKLLGFGRAP